MWGSASAKALSYSAVKLFSKNSNLCEYGTGTWTPETDRQTDAILWQYHTLRIASRGKRKSLDHYSNAWYVGLHITNFGLNSISHLCSLVVLVCGRDRPSADPTVAEAEFRGLGIWRSHTADTPIHNVSNKFNETWNILQKEDHHRAPSNADTKYNELTHTCALKTTQNEFKWQHCKQTFISGCSSLCGQ